MPFNTNLANRLFSIAGIVNNLNDNKCKMAKCNSSACFIVFLPHVKFFTSFIEGRMSKPEIFTQIGKITILQKIFDTFPVHNRITP